MGWLDSPLSVLNGNINAFFEGREVTLDLIAELGSKFKQSKKERDKKYDIYNKSGTHDFTRSRKSYERASEDFNLKEALFEKAIDLYFTKSNLLKKPQANGN
jgi:hypothetical protein